MQQAFALRHDPRAGLPQAYRQDLNVRLVCPDCQDETPDLAEETANGDLVCRNCGLVLGDRIVDTRSEWRTFANDEGGDDPSRVGGPIDPFLGAAGAQMSTVISFKDGQTGVAKDLQRAAAMVRVPGGGSTGQKAMGNVFPAIEALCEKASLPGSVRDTAKQVYQRVDQEKLLRGKNVDAVVATCVYIACRQQRVPRTIKEMVALSNVPQKKIAACFKILQGAFESGSVGGSAVSATGTSTEQLVTRLCSQLGLSVPAAASCASIARRVAEEGFLTGRTPSTVAGACILLGLQLFGEPCDLSEISKVTGVAEGTIRVALGALWPDRERVTQKEWFEAGRKRVASWDNVRGVGSAAFKKNGTPPKTEVKDE